MRYINQHGTSARIGKCASFGFVVEPIVGIKISRDFEELVRNGSRRRTFALHAHVECMCSI